MENSVTDKCSGTFQVRIRPSFDIILYDDRTRPLRGHLIEPLCQSRLAPHNIGTAREVGGRTLIGSNEGFEMSLIENICPKHHLG